MAKSKSARRLSAKQTRDAFLKEVGKITSHWINNVDEEVSTNERLKGLAFSFLSLLDGKIVTASKFQVVPVEEATIEGKAVKQEDISGSLSDEWISGVSDKVVKIKISKNKSRSLTSAR